MIKAVLFDLDETLTDRATSIRKYAPRFQQDFEERIDGLTLADLVRTIDRLDARGYAPRSEVFNGLHLMSGWAVAPSIEEIGAHWLAVFPGMAVGLEGLHDALESLDHRGYQLGIITNGAVRSQRAKAIALRIEHYFQTFVISEEIGIKKPDARVFHAAAHELEIEPKTCLFVGDHPLNDIVGAQDAGLSAVWLSGFHDWPRNTPLPRRQIATVAELVDLPELQAAGD